MNIFRKRPNLFANVPGPSPWYLRANAPTLHGFNWKDAGDAEPCTGKIVLTGPNGPVAIFDFHNYVLALDQSSLLVWHQRFTESGQTAPVNLSVLSTNSLLPLSSDLVTLCAGMKQDGLPLLIDGQTSAVISLSTLNATDELHAEFPPQLSAMDELLVLCHSSGINANTGWEHNNLALLVAHPKEGKYRLYPQDWFNCGGFDYGYQWVTRMTRNPRTGSIHGEGIRIEPFVLDDSLRMTRK